MNTRTFEKVLINRASMIEKYNKINSLNLQTSETSEDKFQCRTYWQDKRPVYKYYKYKSGTAYLHDFVEQKNYQYIPE